MVRLYKKQIIESNWDLIVNKIFNTRDEIKAQTYCSLNMKNSWKLKF